MRASAIIVLFSALALVGCTTPQNAIDCKADSGCMMQALRNGCQDARMENIRDKSGYTLGTADLQVNVTNEQTKCRVEAVWTDASGKTLSSVEAEFRLPLESCKTTIPDSYMTVNGNCVGIDIK